MSNTLALAAHPQFLGADESQSAASDTNRGWSSAQINLAALELPSHVAFSVFRSGIAVSSLSPHVQKRKN
jgi:hypothetical protein